MRYPTLALIVPAFLALGASSCRPADADPPAKPRLVVVHAGDFYFRMPDTLKAGMTRMRLVNAGPGLHHVSLIRLEEGRRMSDLLAVLSPTAALPAWAEEVGGPNASVPGDSTETTLDLTPGNYAAICFIPGPDGVPHVMKGMAHAFTVVPVAHEDDAPPASDVTLTLKDYSFQLTPRLTAGHHELRVVNEGPQSHEVVLVQLAPGRTAADFAAWTEKQEGPPPGRPIGGATSFRPGVTNYVSLQLVPGEYGLICFVPDSKDGKPHLAHGMLTQIRVE